MQITYRLLFFLAGIPLLFNFVGAIAAQAESANTCHELQSRDEWLNCYDAQSGFTSVRQSDASRMQELVERFDALERTSGRPGRIRLVGECWLIDVIQRRRIGGAAGFQITATAIPLHEARRASWAHMPFWEVGDGMGFQIATPSNVQGFAFRFGSSVQLAVNEIMAVVEQVTRGSAIFGDGDIPFMTMQESGILEIRPLQTRDSVHLSELNYPVTQAYATSVDADDAKGLLLEIFRECGVREIMSY